MKLDLELLFANLSRTEEDTSVSRDGVNDYLIDKILFPCMNGGAIRLCDIDFDAFDAEDVNALMAFHSKLESRADAVDCLAKRVSAIQPVPAAFRSFC